MADINQEYSQDWNRIKTDPNYEFGLAQSFVSTVLGLGPSDRFSLVQLLEEIQSDAFSRGINIPNLDLEKVRRDKQLWESRPREEPADPIVPSVDDFHEVLAKLCTDYPDILGHTKGLFIFRFVRGEACPTIPIFVCDQAALKQPKICSLDSQEPKCRKDSLDDFIKAEDKDSKISRTYVAVTVVTPSLKDSTDIVKQIESLEQRFEKVEFISPLRYPIRTTDDYEVKGMIDGVECVRNFCEKVLNNRDLSVGDEEIIKKCFEGKEMVLDYKFLKKGNTGAKVIEVRPHQGYSDMARFVVKYAEKDSKRKLRDEWKRYKAHVGQNAIDGYSAEYTETHPTHDAILYKYASSDGRMDSFPFADIVDDVFLTTEKKKTSYMPDTTISELFDCSVLRNWSNTTRRENELVSALYEKYLTKSDEIMTMARAIDADAAVTLGANHQIIAAHQLETKVKVCHGDLHTENFFKDEEGVYLIDFGWTDSLHSVIDHATLEASLKFKHLPFYLSKEYVVQLETNFLLDIESFDSMIDLSDIDRDEVRSILGFICSIRENAKQFMLRTASPLEYLISLYVISFRQILYSDLNQRYALASSNMLAERIVNLIKSS